MLKKIAWAALLLLAFCLPAVAAPPDVTDLPVPFKNVILYYIPQNMPTALGIQAENQGTVLAVRYTGLIGINCGSNLTCAWSGNTLTLASSAPGTGTVTHVALSAPSGFQVSGSPITTTGTFSLSMPSGWVAGDLLVGNGPNSVARLGLGSNGTCLSVSGGTIAWVPCGSGSGSVAPTNSVQLAGASAGSFAAGPLISAIPLLASSNAFTAANTFALLNNVISVDGTVYPATDVGIQAAITASAALGCGGTVYLPLGSYAINVGNIAIPCPMIIRGAGKGTVLVLETGLSNSNDVFVVNPATDANFIRFQDFSILPASGSHGRYGIHLNGQFTDIQQFSMERVIISGTTSYALYAEGSGSGQGTPSNSHIEHCQLSGGIDIVNGGDTIDIENNQWLGSGNYLFVQNGGSSTINFSHNNVGLGAGNGIEFLGGIIGPIVEGNEIESESSTSGINGALLDFEGTSGSPIAGGRITGNEIQVVNGSNANGIRVNYASNIQITGNKLDRGVSPAVDIQITANSLNAYIGTNDWESGYPWSSQVSNSGTGTVLAAAFSNTFVLGNGNPLGSIDEAGTQRQLALMASDGSSYFFGSHDRYLIRGVSGASYVYDGTASNNIVAAFADAQSASVIPGTVATLGAFALPETATIPTPAAGYDMCYGSSSAHSIYCSLNGGAYGAIGGGFANPMTTLGDTIVGGASGTPTRLALGGAGTFLGNCSGVIGYCTPAGGTSIFTSFQAQSNTAITGSGNYFQITTDSNFSPTYTGSGTSGSPFIYTLKLSSTVVLTNQANTYSSGLQNLNSATLDLPSGAAYAPTTASLFGYDSTNNRAVLGNGTNTSFLTWITAAPTTGHCPQFSGTLGLLNDSGAACNLVTSVATRTGAIVLTLADIGAGAAPTGTFDFSGVTILKARVGATLTTSINGDHGYDTTNKMWHGWDNAADSIFMMFPASASWTNNDCVKVSVASSVITFADAGSACGSGGGNTTSTSLTTNTLPKANGANSIINSSVSDNGTTVSTTEPISVGASVSTTSDGVHPSQLSMVGNTTAPSQSSNNFYLFGPNAATFTNYALQFSATGPAAAGVMLVGSPSSSVSQLTYGLVTTALLSSVQGNGTKVQLSTGSVTSNDLAKFDSNGNTINSSVSDNGTTVATAEALTALTLTATGTTAGFVDYPQGTTSSAVAPCNTATSICEQAPAAVTSYLVTKPGAAANGLVINVNNSSSITQSFSGDASHAIDKTAQTAAVSTATLCAATAGTACGQVGQYRITYNFWGSGTACSVVTVGSVGLNFTWTDEGGNTHTTVSAPMFDQKTAATGVLFNFNTALTTESAGGSVIISTNGTIIQYATTYTACSTGTGTYNVRLSVEQVQ